MPRATAGDGTGIHYETWGRADAPPLLMVMGLGADRRGWVTQRLPFGRHFRCVAFDNRGVGRSDVPPGPYSLEQMADDALAVLDAEGIDSAHVMGASMGGVVAQILGVLHPDRVRSLVLACTACRHHEWRRELLAEWAATVEGEGMRGLAPEAFRWLIGPRLRRRFGLWLNLLARVVVSQPAPGFVAQVHAILDAPDELRTELHHVRAPTLVIVGSQDILTPVGDSEELAELIPGARLEVVPGAAHGFNVEAPVAFNQAVLRFLREAAGLDDADADDASEAASA